MLSITMTAMRALTCSVSFMGPFRTLDPQDILHKGDRFTGFGISTHIAVNRFPQSFPDAGMFHFIFDVDGLLLHRYVILIVQLFLLFKIFLLNNDVNMFHLFFFASVYVAIRVWCSHILVCYRRAVWHAGMCGIRWVSAGHRNLSSAIGSFYMAIFNRGRFIGNSQMIFHVDTFIVLPFLLVTKTHWSEFI